MLCARQIDFLLCQRTWFAASLLWLNGVPASHTGIRQILPSCLRAFPNWDCWQDSGWLHGNHEPPLDVPCVRLPRGALLSTEKHSPEQKQNQTHARVGGAENHPLWEKGGARELQGWLTGAGRSWDGLDFLRRGPQTSSPRITWISASSL